ncbi:1150_t:CDS:2, partial [Paraglomus brasilianum]
MFIQKADKAQAETPSPDKTIFEKAFKVGFQDPTNYVQELREAVMKCSKESVTHYNYLAAIQFSGYGKTRSILEFAKNCHHVYICFHKKDLSGYPKGTPKNEEMLEDLKKGKMVEECHVIAKKWIHSIITTFEHMTTSKDKNEESFWESVIQSTKEHKDINAARHLIILFIDEASALLDTTNEKRNLKEKNRAFRGLCRALHDFNDSVFAILTDTNSLVANLAPSIEQDILARNYDLRVHLPFIYIASTDSLEGNPELPSESDNGHHIVHFGRPLWASTWLGYGSTKLPETKFAEIVTLAKFKLLGGIASRWVDIKKNEQLARLAALAVLASIAGLYVSPISSVAPNLVKSHMATLIGLDESHQRHLITYPSEPLLSEA